MAHVSPDLETFLKADEIMQIFRSAVRKAQAESRRLGVANVYTINGQRYFELPNGEYRQLDTMTQMSVVHRIDTHHVLA